MLNFNQLRAFYHAAKSQNFTQAAKELFVSQPAVTAQIKSLENICNLALFRKKGRKLYLTNEGRVLYEHVCKIFEYEKTIEKVINDMQKLTVGMLRVGTTKTYAQFVMPGLISHFHKTYPHVKIIMNEGSSQDMILDLLELINDVAVISKVITREEVSFIPFRREELSLVVSPFHHLASCESISFEQLAREPIIMKEAGSGTRKEVNALFAANGCFPNILMESSNTELIKHLVQMGEGVTFLVNVAVAQEIADKKLTTVQLRGFQCSLDVNIAYLKKQPLSPPAQAFVDMLETLGACDVLPQNIGALMGKILASRYTSCEHG